MMHWDSHKRDYLWVSRTYNYITRVHDVYKLKNTHEYSQSKAYIWLFFFSKNNNKTNKLLKYCSYAQMVFGRMCWLRQSKWSISIGPHGLYENSLQCGMLELTPFELPEALQPNHKKARVRKNKKVYGASIEEHPSEASERAVEGH